MEAIQMARDAMGTSHSINLDAHVSSSQNEKQGQGLRKVASEANVKKPDSMAKSLFGGTSLLDDNIIPEDAEVVSPSSASSGGEDEATVGRAMRAGIKGLNRFKKAATQVYVCKYI
jgi:hypothetical protein